MLDHEMAHHKQPRAVRLLLLFVENANMLSICRDLWDLRGTNYPYRAR